MRLWWGRPRYALVVQQCLHLGCTARSEPHDASSPASPLFFSFFLETGCHLPSRASSALTYPLFGPLFLRTSSYALRAPSVSLRREGEGEGEGVRGREKREKRKRKKKAPFVSQPCTSATARLRPIAPQLSLPAHDASDPFRTGHLAAAAAAVAVAVAGVGSGGAPDVHVEQAEVDWCLCGGAVAGVHSVALGRAEGPGVCVCVCVGDVDGGRRVEWVQIDVARCV